MLTSPTTTSQHTGDPLALTLPPILPGEMLQDEREALPFTKRHQ